MGGDEVGGAHPGGALPGPHPHAEVRFARLASAGPGCWGRGCSFGHLAPRSLAAQTSRADRCLPAKRLHAAVGNQVSLPEPPAHLPGGVMFVSHHSAPAPRRPSPPPPLCRSRAPPPKHTHLPAGLLGGHHCSPTLVPLALPPIPAQPAGPSVAAPWRRLPTATSEGWSMGRWGQGPSFSAHSTTRTPPSWW